MGERRVYYEAEMLEWKQEKGTSVVIKALFVMIFVNITCIFFAILNFPARYDFWDMYISDLGVNEIDGNINYVSKIIITMMFLFNSILFLSVFVTIKKQEIIMAIGSLIFAIGNFMTAFPTDLYNDLHHIGVLVGLVGFILIVVPYLFNSKFTVNIIIAIIILILAGVYGYYRDPLTQKILLIVSWFLILMAKTSVNIKKELM